MCVAKRTQGKQTTAQTKKKKERSVQRQKNATTTKGMTTFRGSITRFQSAVHVPPDVGTASCSVVFELSVHDGEMSCTQRALRNVMSVGRTGQ